MATYRRRERRDGTIAHQVIFRDKDQGNKQTSLTFDDEDEAMLFKRFLEANDHRLRQAEDAVIEMRSKAPTLNELIEYHLENLTGVEEGTIKTYRSLMRTHVEDSLGRIRIDSLTKKDIIQWLQTIDRTPKSLKNIHSVVSAALATGVGEPDWPIQSNPARGLRMPKGGGKNRERPLFMTRDQVEELAATLDQLHGQYENPFIGFTPGMFALFQAHSGCRFGESTALRAHVDTTVKADGRIILHINRAWKHRATGLTPGDPKTKAGVRDVALSRDFSEILRPTLEATPAGALLFGNRAGERLHQGWFYEKYWKPGRTALVLAGLFPRNARVHDLRHTHASWLIDAGVPLPAISRRLGHEDISTTVNLYGHLVTDADERAADALSGGYKPHQGAEVEPLEGDPDDGAVAA
ncbi:tyrosine-type recombinase/integrase [Nesterenkonia flava]|uniref:Tyrosine-type recombinase/integrase n=1 Tax=Nesterenkonia flava TaxID=469799 RepID=A0ABU1FVJ1_9MICC|nr:tyrosine-type recombinase/integrase [Nesterenkonia flava]MDR5712681.1 tyrosine-type recombinase/integrase [Nesterenkonia flava]